MEDWKEYRLDELYVFGNGLSKGSKYFGYGHPFVSFKTVFNNYFLPEELSDYVDSDEKEQTKCSVQKSDVLLTRTSETVNELGYSCVALRDYPKATFNGFCKRMRPITEGIIHDLYAGYYFRSSHFRNQVCSMSNMVTRASLSNEMLGRLTIKLPSYKTQTQIGELLFSIDRKIALNRQINDNLEQQASNLFQDWLNNCENSIMLRELTDNVLDYTPNTHEYVYLLNSSDVTEGQFTVLPLTPNINLKGQFKKRFKKGDILYSEIRPRNRHYAYCYFDADKYIASTRLIVLRAKPEMLTSSILLYQYLMLNNVFEEFTLKTESRSGTFPQGNYEDLSSIKVPYGASQEKIVKALESIYKQLWINLEENERLEALRDSLLPKLMSGELKINEIDC